MKNKQIRSKILIVLLFILTVGCNGGFQSEEDTIREELDSLNAGFPLIYDDYTRIEKVELIGKRKLRYKGTLLKIDDKTPKVFVDVLKYESMKRCEEEYRNNPKMKDFRDNKFEIHFAYYDKDGKFLFENIIKPVVD